MKHFKKSSSKFLNGLNKLFKQKYVLYALVVISLVYLFLLLQSRNFYAIYFFILLGIIIYCYSKNMAILLTVCVIFTAIIFPIKTKEGLTNTKPKQKKESLIVTTSGTGSDETATIETTGGASGTVGGKKVLNNIVGGTEKTDIQTNLDAVEPASSGSTTTDSFTGKLANQSRMDPAATMDKAFSNLEGMLGNNGIKNLTNDTEQLISNQTKLFKTIENMTPLIEKASSIMSKINF
jgi:hypothetical protein